MVLNTAAKVLNHLHGHLDVRQGDKSALNLNLHGTLCVATHEHESRKVLAALAAVHRDTATFEATLTVDSERRAAGRAVDLNAELAQSGDEVAERTYSHVLIADESHVSRNESGKASQKTHGGTGVTNEDIGGRSAQLGHATVDFEGGAVDLDLDTHSNQGITHVLGIIGVEASTKLGDTVVEGGKDQGTVGNALGAGHAPGSVKRTRQRLHEDGRHDVVATKRKRRGGKRDREAKRA
mmetsp:Transcript_4966/g.10327  ORF Transcript_4966/g.10327 Transcript_4966/m.10327 type:complete len:238 (+) Transcript_4966:1199-1912(+)